MQKTRIIGIDPGLRHMGWGIIDKAGNHLSFVAAGTINTDGKLSLAARLEQLYKKLYNLIETYQPNEAAIEYVFVNKDAKATLKLGHARAICLLVPAQFGLTIEEYAPNAVKKNVVGVGHANKDQIAHMVKLLLPQAVYDRHDAADALAIAICHAHHCTINQKLRQYL